MTAIPDEPLPGEYIELDGINVWHVNLGSGEPIVLIHGIPTSSYLWRNIQKPLSEKYQTIAPDLIGLGKSDGPEKHSFRLQDQAEMIRLLLDALGIERAIFVAHDIGGGVAQFFTERYPDRVRALILMNVVAFRKYWPVASVKLLRLPLLGDSIKLTPAGVIRLFIRTQLKRGLFHKDRLTKKLFETYSARMTTPQGRLEFLKFIRALDPVALEAAIEKTKDMRIPVLILWAEKDVFQPAEEGQRLFDIIRSGKFVRIAEAGHFLQEDQPERIVKEITRFLSELPPPVQY